MTNLLFVSVVVTNWFRFSGDVKIEDATNRFSREHCVITTSNLVLEVTRCTNTIPFKVTSNTNGLTRWVPYGLVPPPLPGQRQKE